MCDGLTGITAQAVRAATMLTLFTATATTANAVMPTFSPPLLVSAPVQCYDAAQKKLCGYLQVSDGHKARHPVPCTPAAID